MSDAIPRAETAAAATTPELAARLAREIRVLHRRERRLLEAEIGARLRLAGVALAAFVLAAAAALAAVNLLAGAAAAGLVALGAPTWLAPLAITTALLLGAVLLVRGGIELLGSSFSAPERTRRALARDWAALREAIR